MFFDNLFVPYSTPTPFPPTPLDTTNFFHFRSCQRSRVTTLAQDNRLRTQHLCDRYRPATRTSATTIGNHGRPISAQTVINRLRAHGIRPRRPYVGPQLLQRHRRARLQWCRAHVRRQAGQWNQVLFSDESRFTLERSDGRARVYRRSGERYTDACVKQTDRFRGGSVMVWAGINNNRKTNLVIIIGNLNAQRYRDEILAPVVILYVNANPNAIFQQDNARPYTARLTTQYLQANNVDVMEWPSKSPDLSPIEQVWDLLDRRVRQRPVQPQTLRQLQHALVQEWNNNPMNVIRRYIRSMRRRCRAVIQSAGGHTRYWNVVTFENQPQWRVCDHCGVIWWVNSKPLMLFTVKLLVFIWVKFHDIIVKNEWAIWIWSLCCVSSLG